MEATETAASTSTWVTEPVATDSSVVVVVDDVLPPQFDEMSLVKTTILGVMFLIAFAGNAFTITQLLCLGSNGARPVQKSNINLLIFHLAVSDLVVAFFCNVTDAVWSSTVQWYAGNWGCKILKYVQLFGLYQSTYITVVIGLDRAMAVLFPLGHNSKARVRTMIATSYVLSAVLSLPQVSSSDFSPLRSIQYNTMQYNTVLYNTV